MQMTGIPANRKKIKMKIIREKERERERELVSSMACFFLFFFFSPQICVVGGLAIMHTRTLPNLARH